jgi:hypothetical protein
MSELQTATSSFSFNLGFLLFFLMPRDIVTMTIVGAYEVKPPALTAHQVHHTSERREFLREVATLGSDA